MAASLPGHSPDFKGTVAGCESRRTAKAGKSCCLILKIDFYEKSIIDCVRSVLLVERTSSAESGGFWTKL